MRILTFTSLFPNASNPVMGVFVRNRMQAVHNRGENQVDVVAPIPYSSKALPVAAWRRYAAVPQQEKIGDLTVFHPRYPVVPKISLPFQGLSMFLSSYRLVKRLHRDARYDCIDAHYVYPDGFAAVLLGRALDLPVAVSARGSDINLYATLRQVRAMVQFTVQHADGLIAVSSALADGMLGLGASAAKLKIIGNGVDTQMFHPIDPQDARRKLGIPLDAQLVICVAGLADSKGHALLIRAIHQLRPRMPNLRVVCIGEGNLRAEIESLIRQLHLHEQVSLLDVLPRQELKYWYSAADVSCLASTREGWPNVILESFACGTPVVATRVGGVPQVIDSPKLGIIVSRDVSEFASALEAALNYRWDREALVAHARSRSWDVVAAEVDVFLRGMVEGRRMQTGDSPVSNEVQR